MHLLASTVKSSQASFIYIAQNHKFVSGLCNMHAIYP